MLGSNQHHQPELAVQNTLKCLHKDPLPAIDSKPVKLLPPRNLRSPPHDAAHGLSEHACN
eukprot:13042993-Alexandrium_andersonii.AAC.1